MSVRAELVRLGARQLIKYRSGNDVTIEQLRRRAAAFARLVPMPPPHTQTREVIADGVKACHITTPASQSDRCILFIHGGGYIIGSPCFYRHFTWRLATATHAHVLSLDYRLAPEHPFPAALDDAFTGYQWVLANGVEPERVAVIGDSAGGGLALALLLRLRDQGIRLPAAAVALSPWTDLTLSGASLARNAMVDPMVNISLMRRSVGFYLDGADPHLPYASPLYSDPDGLPPTLIHVGSDEILRDDSVRMADRMRAAGCRVRLEIWPRMPHVWHLFAPVVPEARRAIENIGTFVRGTTQP
jgi:epsilon-lactone hydrolase